MATNSFVSFASGDDANVLTDTEYQSEIASNGSMVTGMKQGLAVSKAFNKIWRQTTIWAAVLGQIIADYGQDANDSQTIATVQANFLAAIRSGYALSSWVSGNFVGTTTATSGSGDLRIALAAYGHGYSAPYLRGWNDAGSPTDYILATQSWVSGNFVNGTAAGQNANVQNIQISNYASGLGGNQTYLQVTPPGASAFAIPSVGYGNNIWQSKGNYVATSANTSGASGDLQISAAYYSNASGAPYLSGYNASGTMTSYILATQDWTNGRFATLDNLSSTNNTLNENTQNINSALNATNTQVSNLNDLKISTSTNTSGSGNTKVDSIYYSGAAGKLAIVYYDSNGDQVTKFLTVTS
ncbi:hypothetical protein [Acetobacter sicerae]|uniref:hypothetical protein n=1 Tax=Acetobacter sicerae TaxID=85325 RepID=UPI00156BB66C|nr:hypothetical protein [Acetobacter sicerae]NHN93455.1 hypothetical protein [Acetobacter sicerae]